MFDWILSWAYKAIGEAADSFAQSLIGDGNTDGVLALKLSSLVASFPGFATLYEILQSFSLGLTIILGAYSLIKFFVGKSQDQNDTPISTLLRCAIAGAAIYFGNYAVDLAVQAANAPYTALWHSQVESAGGETISITDVAASIAVGGAGVLLSLIFLIIICWNLVKLFLEMFERLFMVGVLAYSSPLAFATIASSSTSQVFKKWSNMLVGQLVLMSLTAWSVKLILASMANVATIPGFLFVLAACRVAQRMDTYLQQLGINTVTTGAGMVGELAAAGYMASRVFRGSGRGGDRSNAAPLGSNLNNGIGGAPKSSYFGGVLGGTISAARKGSYVRKNGGTMQEAVREAGKGFMKGVSPFQRFKENAAEQSQTVEAVREAAAVSAATAGNGGSYARRSVAEEKPGSRQVDANNDAGQAYATTMFTDEFTKAARDAGLRPEDWANESLASNGAGGFERSEPINPNDLSAGMSTELDNNAIGAGLHISDIEGGEDKALAGPMRSRQEFLANQQIESFVADYNRDKGEDPKPKYSPYTVFNSSTMNMDSAGSVGTLFAEGREGGIGRLDADASPEAKAIENDVVNNLAHSSFGDAFARHGISTEGVHFGNYRKDVTEDRGSVIYFTGKTAEGQEEARYMVADQAAAATRVEFSRAATADYQGLGRGTKGKTEYGTVNIGGKNYAVVRTFSKPAKRSGKPEGYTPPPKPKKRS